MPSRKRPVIVDFPAAAAESAARFGTPCYVFSWPHVIAALQELHQLDGDVPVHHWLSFKTQPVRRLVREWSSRGRGVEVVSEYELLAASHEGIQPEQLLVNGVAKHTWLPRSGLPGIRVHFDSLTEVEQLASIARDRHWRVGIRLAAVGQYDPDEPRFLSQFGLTRSEVPRAMQALSAARVAPESVHFHLRSNVASPGDYRQAIIDVAETCLAARFPAKVPGLWRRSTLPGRAP